VHPAKTASAVLRAHLIAIFIFSCPEMSLLNFNISARAQLYSRIGNVANMLPPDTWSQREVNSVHDMTGRMGQLATRPPWGNTALRNTARAAGFADLDLRSSAIDE
jgi:hypothetical protein